MGNDREQRPNPDELLARVQAETARSTRGRLKVFFGSSAGVGKTYAMLQAARLQRDAGVDVVVGYVETHGRAETEAQLGGLEVLPRLTIPYKGATLPEFDLDAALQRRPGLLLVDELAHTNAPGSRHAKRWQDVLELVESGVDVYTTVNVQHLESLNDVVAQITGVIVRETVPDSVLDQADEIELIDLPADELLRRLEEGKVYIADQAARAARNFFRPGNLIALREMALRRTAERVDAQMRAYRQTHSIGNTWHVVERLLVCVGPSPFSAQLVRATARLAGRLGAEWTAAFVETPEYGGMSEEARARVAAALRLAEQLGGNTITLTAAGVSAAVLHYARSSNVTTIVTGKPAGALWRRLLFPSLVDDLLRESGDIEIHALRPPPETQAVRAPRISAPSKAKDHVAAMVVVAVCVVFSLLLRESLEPANLVMIYLLGVVAVGMFARRQVALWASVVSVAAFDFFCVPPYLTFAVSDYQYLVTFGAMLTVGLTISGLTVKLRGQAARAIDRETRTQALYRFTRELAAEGEIFALARRATELLHEAFQSPAMIVLAERGQVHFRRRTTDQLIVPATEESIAQWAFDHGQAAGRGTDTLSGATALYLPLRGHGVMVIVAGPEQQAQLELFAYQTALALDRVQAAKAARESEVRIKTEEMRSGLLSAVSHDLRTPLASITGAATSLLGQGEKFSAETRQELLESIADEAERLGRLVNNLLEMTRLDSGTAPVARDWYSVEEMVGATLQRLTKILAKHPVATRLPEDLPLAYVDEVLIGQVLANLLENAAKYTPAGTAIEIAASAEGDTVTVAVSDRGPGFAAEDVGRVFEKFYRGRADGVRGVGLGLAIAHAIVTAHGGTMEAANRPEGGAQIRFTLAASAAPAP